MTQNAIFLDCSSKVQTINVLIDLPEAPELQKLLKKNSDAGGDEKLIIGLLYINIDGFSLCCSYHRL